MYFENVPETNSKYAPAYEASKGMARTSRRMLGVWTESGGGHLAWLEKVQTRGVGWLARCT